MSWAKLWIKFHSYNLRFNYRSLWSLIELLVVKMLQSDAMYPWATYECTREYHMTICKQNMKITNYARDQRNTSKNRCDI